MASLSAGEVEAIHQTANQCVRQVFVSHDGALRDAVVQMLKLDGLYEEGDTLSDAVSKTQKAWVATMQGRGGKERIDLVDAQGAGTEEVVAIAKNLGLFDAKVPTLSHYDYALCLGSTLDDVRGRIAELVKTWQAGVHFDALVFLSGERELRQGLEDKKAVCDQAQSPLPFKANWTFPDKAPYATECDMMRIVWEQVQLPDDMERALRDKVFFVNAKAQDGLRPSTRDTYIEWLNAFHPKPGTVLAMSRPGFWIYQQLVGANALGAQFFLDTVAPAVPQKDLVAYRHALVAIIHDTVAKCLYEIASGQ